MWCFGGVFCFIEMTLSQQNMTCDRFSSSICRPCVRCVWTGWRTWSSCAAMAPASCVGTEWASVPSAARPSNAASSSTRRPPPPIDSLSYTRPRPQSQCHTSCCCSTIFTPFDQPAKGVLKCLTRHNKCFLMVWLCSGGFSVTKQGENMNWLAYQSCCHHVS